MVNLCVLGGREEHVDMSSWILPVLSKTWAALRGRDLWLSLSYLAPGQSGLHLLASLTLHQDEVSRSQSNYKTQNYIILQISYN
jgi:hypothetical protein